MSAETLRVEPTLRVALGEYDTGWHDPAGSLMRAGELVARAAQSRARLVVLPEMCTTGFSMAPGNHAEPLGGVQTSAFAALAKKHDLWILAGLSMRDDGGRAGSTSAATLFNGAVFFSPAGEVASIYRKQRLFSPAGEHEYYVPGDQPAVMVIDGVRVSPFICYDLRFPELFRAVAGEVDAFLLIANWPAARGAHWDVLVRARAIENLCHIVAVNRDGVADGILYDGRSIAYGPWGEELPDARSGRELAEGSPRPRIVEIDAAKVAATRAKFPFLQDRVETLLSVSGQAG
jgi:predicted amidohydrolase